MSFFKDVPKKGTAFLCLVNPNDEVLLTYNERKRLDNGDFKEPGWGMPGGGVVDWQTWSSEDHEINERINLFKKDIPEDCEFFLEGMLREAFEEGNVFFLNNPQMFKEILRVIQELFKVFEPKKVLDLWKEKINLFHQYALETQKQDIFETVLIEPEMQDRKTGKMRGPIHIFKSKERKVYFPTLAEVSAVNDLAQTVSKSEWLPIEKVKEILLKEFQDLKVSREDYIYKNHGRRLQKIGVINFSRKLD